MKIRLFCIPYAGGSAVSYNSWKAELEEYIELFTVELPGRGDRYREPMCSSMEEAVEDVYRSVNRYLDPPYAIFGHSMGSSLTYELFHKLKQTGHPLPVHLFFSGMNPPHINCDDVLLYNLPNELLMEELLKLGGTVKDLFTSKKLLERYLPMIRNDLRILETKEDNKRPRPLDCNMTVLYGNKDYSMKGCLDEWKRYTKYECNIVGFDGGHFFIFEKQKEVVKLINNVLDFYLRREISQLDKQKGV